MTSDFVYIPRSIPGPGCPSVWYEEELEGCSCAEECSTATSCPCLLGAEDNYTDELYSEKSSGAPVVECYDNCGCSSGCRNRLLQKGISVKLKVYVHSIGKGFGVKADESIKKGSFVCEYAGEIIGKEEVDNRAEMLRFHNYIFTVKEHCSDGQQLGITYIDPKFKGNLARFINHSCEPNLTIVPVRLGNPVPLIGLFAARDIHPGEELCYSYGPAGTSGKKCLCGAPSCGGYLPFSISASE